MIEIDGFEDFHPIGVGSFGDVYSAWDSTRHRLVAIKVLRSELADDPEHRGRFIREGERLADLDHRGVVDALVDIICSGEVDGRPYLVMSYADRGTLGERGPFIADAELPERLELAARLVASLSTALGVVHDNGLIHRDVKPSNIMFHSTSEEPIEPDHQDDLIGPDEAMVLGDFGLATSYVDPTTVRVMPAGVGTHGYVPPEATNPEIGWLPQSDLYSATVVVVFALTGKPADGPWQQRLKEAGYSDELLAQIKKGLNENLTQRHANIDQWATELSAAINHARAHEPSTGRKGKRLLIPAVAAAIGIAAIGLFAALSGATGSLNRGDNSTAATSLAGPVDSQEPQYESSRKLISGENGPVIDVDWSPDGSQLASAGDDQTIRIWNPETQQETSVLEGHEGVVWTVDWSPDGRHLASVDIPQLGDGTAIIWSADDSSLVRKLPQVHEGPIRAVAWHPEGQLLATGGQDGDIRIWDSETGEQIGETLDHGLLIWELAWSPDGSTLASASADGVVRIWDPSTGAENLALGNPEERATYSVAWSPNGDFIAAGDSEDTVRVWDKTGTEINTFSGHEDDVWGVSWDRIGEQIASVSLDGSVRVWDVDDPGNPIVFSGHEGGVLSADWDPNSNSLATSGGDGAARMWDPSTGKQVEKALLGHTSKVWSAGWNPDGTKFVTGDEDFEVEILGSDPVKRLTEPLVGHSNTVWSVAWNPTNELVASSSPDGTVQIWDSEAGDSISGIIDHGGNVRSVDWSADGLQLASASTNGTVNIWEARSGQQINDPLTGEGGAIYDVAWHPTDSTILASANDDGTIDIWDTTNQTRIGQLSGHKEGAWAIDWSPNGRQLGSVSADQTVRIWDIETFTQLGDPITGHVGPIWAVSWHPEGTKIATGGADETVRIWDVESRKLVMEPLSEKSGAIQSVSWHPTEDKLLTTAGADVIIWSSQN